MGWEPSSHAGLFLLAGGPGSAGPDAGVLLLRGQEREGREGGRKQEARLPLSQQPGGGDSSVHERSAGTR